jgi:hypothetical protein
MILDDGERRHPLWKKIEGYLNEQLATLRAQNDAVIDDAKTNYKRGEIAQVKKFLEIGKEQPDFDK